MSSLSAPQKPADFVEFANALSPADFASELLNAAASVGFETLPALVFDSVWHRPRGEAWSADKATNAALAYIASRSVTDDGAHRWIVHFKNFQGDQKETVYGLRLASERYEAYKAGKPAPKRSSAPIAMPSAADIAKAVAKREAATGRAIAQAKKDWASYSTDGGHPYLERKGVDAHGVRFGSDEDGPFIAVPMVDIDGELKSIQRIYADKKRFIKGAPTLGLFHVLGKINSTGPLFVAEGYASAASVYEASGVPTVVALSTSNLLPAAQALRARYPGAVFTFAADNDRETARKLAADGRKNNPGIRAAVQAAAAVGGFVTRPRLGRDGGDFNDLHQAAGLAAVAEQLQNRRWFARVDDEVSSAADGNTAEPKPATETPKRASALSLMAGMFDDVELFHDSAGAGYAVLPVDDHCEVWSLKARAATDWLSRRLYCEHGIPANADSIKAALNLAQARARFDGDKHAVSLRTAMADGALYVDLCDERWRAVEITADGWRIVDTPPVRFTRKPGMLAIPDPTRDGSIDSLWPIVNVPADDRVLVAAWLVKALVPAGAHPLLAFAGEAGGAKSTTQRLLRALIDPSAAPLRAAPREERDLHVAAANSALLAFDNLSSIPGWLSDALCQLSTGAGFATRALFTDSDETLFAARRPVMLNAIGDVLARQDLIDRAIVVNVEPLPGNVRRTDDDILAEFDRIRPGVTGALFDAVATALGNYDSAADALRGNLPRMADYALWATAAEPSLNVEPGAFLARYTENRTEAADALLESTALVSALVALMRDRRPGGDPRPLVLTASELYEDLERYAGDQANKPGFPQSAKGKASALMRLAPALRNRSAEAINIQRKRPRGTVYTLLWLRPPASRYQIDREHPQIDREDPQIPQIYPQIDNSEKVNKNNGNPQIPQIPQIDSNSRELKSSGNGLPFENEPPGKVIFAELPPGVPPKRGKRKGH